MAADWLLALDLSTDLRNRILDVFDTGVIVALEEPAVAYILPGDQVGKWHVSIGSLNARQEHYIRQYMPDPSLYGRRNVDISTLEHFIRKTRRRMCSGPPSPRPPSHRGSNRSTR